MTWTKFGSEFRDECAEAGLSDAAFRTHVEAIMYLYGIESMDMKIQRHLVRRWAGSDNYQDAVRELVAKDYWTAEGNDWRVVHHEHVFRQSLGYQLRERDRSRKAMQKQREKATEADAVAQDVTPSVTRNVTQDVTRNVMRAQSVSQTDFQTAAIRDEVSGEICDVCGRDDEGRRTRTLIHCDTCQGIPDEQIDQTTGEVLDFLPATTPTDPWNAPTPMTKCTQCQGWVGADREKAGMPVCGPCARGDRRAS